MDFHVLIDSYGQPEEKIFDVTGAVAGSACRIGDDAVEVQFGVCNTDRWGLHVLISVKAIPSYCHSDAMNFRFSGGHSADMRGVSNFAACRDL